MRVISTDDGWKLPKSCSRSRGSSYTLMVCRGNGDGAGSSEVSSCRIPSVVSRVRRYGLVKKCSVSSGLSSCRSRRPASRACRGPINRPTKRPRGSTHLSMAFWCELDSVIWHCLMYLAIFVALRLAMANEND